MLAALLLHNDTVVSTIRRELRRVVDVLVDDDVITRVLRDEVIKRDTLEGPSADIAAKRGQNLALSRSRSWRNRQSRSHPRPRSLKRF